MAFTMVNSLAESQLSSVVTEVCIYYYVEDGDNKTLVGLVLKDGGRICFSVFPKREGSRDAEIRWCYIPESESRNGVDRRKVLKPNMTVADVRRLLTDLGRGNYTCPPNERANEWWGSVIYKDMVLWGYIPPVPVEESHVAWGGEGKFAYHTGGNLKLDRSNKLIYITVNGSSRKLPLDEKFETSFLSDTGPHCGNEEYNIFVKPQ